MIPEKLLCPAQAATEERILLCLASLMSVISRTSRGTEAGIQVKNKHVPYSPNRMGVRTVILPKSSLQCRNKHI